MELIGAMLVFLGLACAGFLAGLFVVVVRFKRSTAEQHAEAMEAAEQHHRELRSQLTATTATILDRVQLVAGALAAQIQATVAEQRNDLRLAGLLPPLHVPGEEQRGKTRSATTPPNGSPAARARSSTTPATSSTTRPSLARVASTLRDDDATPPSGLSLEQIRAHTERAEAMGEERPT